MPAWTRLVRELNWARRRWSATADRAYHDDVFKDARYDAADASYPGSITIRRFADLAAPYVATSRTVVDLGCGPGEITCELARRFPEATFLGVDHSETALERATRESVRLGLANIEFVAGDLRAWTPEASVDLVAMFDAFHHVPEPRALIKRLCGFTDRFFLIEPAGNWYGGWQQDLSLDWVAEAIFLIRDRLQFQFGIDTDGSRSGAEPVAEPAGAPIERRYPLEDFERLFEGFGLDVQGTTAGIERYGTRPEAASPLRRDVGELTYRLFVDLDALLRTHDLDLGAKHWAIYAERGRVVARRRVAVDTQVRTVATPVRGPYDAEYVLRDAPESATAGAAFHVRVDVTNRSWRTWASDESPPFFLSSRVVDRRGRVVIQDGPRTPWPGPVAPGHSCSVYLRVQAPAEAGRYRVLIDGVHEGVTWFSEVGVPPLAVDLVVKP